MRGLCDVCGQIKDDCEYCDFCKALICRSCKYSPKRITAWLRRKGVSKERFEQWLRR